jgi:predicted O-methyltransferase YrrM
MFEDLLANLPEAALACRRLYDASSGGYHLPHRDHQDRFGLADVAAMRQRFAQVQYDCIEVPVADLLATLIVNTRSRLILETGTSRGFSTCHLAAAARCVHGAAARVVTLDPALVPNRFYVGAGLAASIDAQRVDSLTVDGRALTDGADFDFLFLDSMHSYGHLAREIELFLPQLRLGGLMALHDTFFFDGLGLVTLMLMQCQGLEAISFPTHRSHGGKLRSPGVSLFRKLAPIEAGTLRFPRLPGALDAELVTIQDPAAIVDGLGMTALRAPYAARNLLAAGRRHGASPALLDPAGEPRAAAVPQQPAAMPVAQLRSQAMAAASGGAVDQSLALLQQALALAPGDADVVCDLAALALSSGDPAAAVKLARKALQIAPEHATSQYTLGMALAQGGATSSAIRALLHVASGAGAAALRSESGSLLADGVPAIVERLRRVEAVTA